MTIRTNRAVAVVTAAALALTSVGVAPAFAASKPVKEIQTANPQAATDFSSYRRHGYYGHRRGYGNAAAFAAIIGAVGAYAAAREYRKARERSYYNGYNGYNGYGNGHYYRPHYRSW